MIKITKDTQEEIKKILELYRGTDEESKKLAQSLVLNANWYQRMNPKKILVGIPWIYGNLDHIFVQSDYYQQEFTLNQLVSEDKSIRLYSPITIKLTPEELSSVRESSKAYSGIKYPFDSKEILKKVWKSDWYKRLLAENVYVHRGSSDITRIDKLYSPGMNIYMQSSFITSLLLEEGKVELYQLVQYD